MKTSTPTEEPTEAHPILLSVGLIAALYGTVALATWLAILWVRQPGLAWLRRWFE